MSAPPERTVRQIIQKAYQKIGVYATGEAISADDMNDGLLSFQDMIAGWSGDGFLIPVITQESFPLVAGQSSYTIGESGVPDLDTVRPDQIMSAFIRDGDHDSPLKIISGNAFSNFSDKSNGGGEPEYLWYDPSTPNGTINVYRVPISANTLFIRSQKPLSDGAALTDDAMLDLGIPRNYHNPMIYNLAIELAPEYGVDPSVIVAAKADDGMTMIRSLNAANKVNAISIDFANGHGSNEDMVRY